MHGWILFSLALFGIRRRCKTELFHNGFGYACAQFRSAIEFDDLRQEAPIAHDSELYLLAQLWRAGGGGNTGDTGIAQQQHPVIADRNALARRWIGAAFGVKGNAVETYGKVVGAIAQPHIAC